MTTVLIKDLDKHLDSEVTIRGWVRHHRKSGKIQFVVIRDGSGFAQMIFVKNELEEKPWEDARSLTTESCVAITGIVQQNPRNGKCEILAKGIEIIHLSEPFPITPKEHGVEFLMDNRHLWFRSKKQWAVLRIRHTIIKAVRDFFDSRDFTLIDSPILTPTSAEGSSSLFEVNYFDDQAFLSQTGQLYLEPAAASFGKVYCFGPTFRAEKSKTRRHLTEFWMVEPEIAFAHLDDIMKLSEEFIHAIVTRVLEENPFELEILERDTDKLKAALKPFVRMTYDEAVAKLKEQGSDINWGEDFGGDDETMLTKQYDQPIIVHRFPKVFKAFYMEPDPENRELVLGMDVLAPEGYGEIIGGGERASSIEYLLDQLEQHKLDQEPYEWYLDVRRYGSFPHAGFGMGIERAVAWICKLPHVRETIPYPRMLSRLSP
ncbi:MAG: asparagine--tRNA ligase [Acidobacteria bacterium]|nr:MAG: asparagine--tRNA ligase [Acidobacteriota bacterium]